jgi:hypothetical protein
MKKLNKKLILLINIAVFSTFFVKNVFSMKRTISRDDIRRYSRPIDRERNSSPGILQELLIASGYFFFEESLTQILENLTSLEGCTKDVGFKKKKKALENWKKENKEKISISTKEISNLIKNLDEYVENYNFIASQQITDIRQEEINRIVVNSLESLPKVLDRLKTYIYTKDNDILDWILSTIKSQQNCYIFTITEDFINRNWETETMLDLEKDTIRLAELINSTDKIIWNNFINKNLLSEIFNKIQEKIDRKEAIKKIQILQETFSFRI